METMAKKCPMNNKGFQIAVGRRLFVDRSLSLFLPKVIKPLAGKIQKPPKLNYQNFKALFLSPDELWLPQT
jgi:hypothetical protein